MPILKLAEIEDEGERKTEAMRRQDVNAANVAQEALDCYRELEANGQSSSEVFTEHGFLLCDVLKPAIADEKRIIKELGEKPSKDVSDGVLKVSDVQTKYSIDEFVPPPKDPEPEVIE